MPLSGGPAVQSFVLPLGTPGHAFVHFRCEVDGPPAPRAPEAGSAPVAFLDEIELE
jgi:hypothetical protein